MKLAATIAEMELDHVVITSVDRDDLPDQGASHFAACIQAVRETCPQTGIEVLVPDFEGREDLLQIIVDAAPDVLAHNIECCRSLTPTVRDPRASYDQSLQVLETFKRLAPTSLTKSSIMVGLGERADEVVQTMADLRAAGTDFLTVGQYLQPTPRHLEVRAFVTPEQFDAYQSVGLKLGFAYVASGPLVRSSYRAGEFFIRDYLARQTADAGVEARP
jgi:lipoic acid synthetase